MSPSSYASEAAGFQGRKPERLMDKPVVTCVKMGTFRMAIKHVIKNRTRTFEASALT
uniref:Uncharacterized protein n=1 Tax=Helianthus annuus TaxID=4232 RepID=A0A251V2Q5_HELAN